MSYATDYAKNKNNNLSDFARKALVAVANNEAKSDSQAFKITEPNGVVASSYSFGFIQFDLK